MRMIVSISSDSCTLPLISLNTRANRSVLNGVRLILNPNSAEKTSIAISIRLMITTTKSNILNYSEVYFLKPNAINLTTHSIRKMTVNM